MYSYDSAKKAAQSLHKSFKDNDWFHCVSLDYSSIGFGYFLTVSVLNVEEAKKCIPNYWYEFPINLSYQEIINEDISLQEKQNDPT